MTDKTLLPCPFCGGFPEFSNTDERARLHCTGCGTEGGLFFFSQEECATGLSDETEARAIDAWNIRQASTAPAGVTLPEKARAGIEVLHNVVESLLATGRYVDEEGEATLALADLSDCIADPPFRLSATAPAGVTPEQIVEAIAKRWDGCFAPMFDLTGNLTDSIDIGATIRADHASLCRAAGEGTNANSLNLGSSAGKAESRAETKGGA